MNHSIISLLRPAWLNPATALVATALTLLTACGGGGDTAVPPGPLPAALLGDPVTATVGAAGGNVTFTASGVAGSLAIPAGALAADTAITVTPVAPGAEEWARVNVSGIDTVLEQPATLTLTLPAGSTLDAAAAVTQLGSEGDVLLPASVDTAGRQVSVPVQRFSVGARTVEQAGERNHALAAVPSGRSQALAAQPGDPASTLILNQRLQVRLRVITAEARYQQLVRARDYSSTLELSMSIAALLQASGLDGYAAEALPWLQRAQTGACENLRGAIERAQSEPAPTTLDLEGRIGNAYVTRLSAPVLYWSGVADRLGGSCPNLNPSAALNGVHQRLLAVIADKLVQRQDAATLRGAVGEAAAAAALKRQADTLAATRVGPRSIGERSQALGSTAAPQGRHGRLDAATNPATLGAQIRDEVTTPALAPIRAGMWTGAMASGTSAEYGRPLQIYGTASPLADDVQQVGTTVKVQSVRGSGSTLEVLDQAQGGAGPTPAQTVRDLSVAARSGAQLTVNGPIDVLSCPGAAQERLVIEFEGAVVLDRASAGVRLLDAPQTFDVDALLQAAGIRATDARRHQLRVKRVGSSCNAVFGLADDVLSTITLDFGAADAITREITDVKEAMWLNPSDATLTRLNTLRGTLLARGEGSRAESLLADRLVMNPLSCVQDRAHRECAAGLRGKGEATLGLVKGITNGSTGLDWLYSRAKDSLRVCPYPAFMTTTGEGSVFGYATFSDITLPPANWEFFLSISWDQDDRIRGFSFSAADEANRDRHAVSGYAPTGPGNGSLFTGRIQDGDLRGTWGNRFLLLDYQSRATAPTVSVSVNGTAVTANLALYEGEYEGVMKTARISFTTTVTLPPAPDLSCTHTSLPSGD